MLRTPPWSRPAPVSRYPTSTHRSTPDPSLLAPNPLSDMSYLFLLSALPLLKPCPFLLQLHNVEVRWQVRPHGSRHSAWRRPWPRCRRVPSPSYRPKTGVSPSRFVVLAFVMDELDGHGSLLVRRSIFRDSLLNGAGRGDHLGAKERLHDPICRLGPLVVRTPV